MKIRDEKAENQTKDKYIVSKKNFAQLNPSILVPCTSPMNVRFWYIIRGDINYIMEQKIITVYLQLFLT